MANKKMRVTLVEQQAQSLPIKKRPETGRIDNVHGRESLPRWAQDRLRQFELNFDLDGETAFVEDDDKLLLIHPDQPDMIKVIHRYPRPFGGMNDSVEIRFNPGAFGQNR